MSDVMMTMMMRLAARLPADGSGRDTVTSTHRIGELYERHRARVKSYVDHRLRGAAVWDDVDDIVQTTFTRVLPHLPNLPDDDDQVAAYLCRVAANLLIDRARSGHTRYVRYLGSLDEHDTPIRDVYEEVASAEVAWAISEAVRDTLTVNQREVVVLRFVAGLSTAETATWLGRSVSQVKALQYRALRALARSDRLRGLWADR